MRTLLSFLFASSGSRTSRRGRVARRSRVAPGERLEPRINLSATLIDLASARAASNGFPAYGELPIPAGATLVDVSDKGDIVLFSSTDTNVVAGQQTVPSIHPNLFWLNTTTGETRLVTHRAGSTVQSAGYAGLQGDSYVGPGLGLWPAFEPLSADLSGDGQSVVFDSIIQANEYDSNVPLENDQATFRPPEAGSTTQSWQNLQRGTVDVFVWRAGGDPANNISLVSRLNDQGQQEAVNLVVPGVATPIVGQPMATGVFAEEYLPILQPNFRGFLPRETVESLTANKGISDDGKRVLYDSWVPAGWIDTVNPAILDQSDTTQGYWTLDNFVASTDGFNGSGATPDWAARTVTVTSTGAEALGYYQGPILGQNYAQLFEPLYAQLSGEGNRVVYSTRRTGADIVAGTTDSDFSMDVFTNDVDTGTNLLVSRNWGNAATAAGATQPNFFQGGSNPFRFGAPPTEFWDSQNHAISNDGRTIAFTSSAGNLVQGWINVTADLAPFTIVGANGGLNWTTYQAGPIDIYGFQFDSTESTVATGKTALINSPDGSANTNRIAGFGGMSGDGSTFLFGTVANNFYLPGFTPPYPYTANPPQAPLPLNFILGGFSNLWARKVDWSANATGTTELVSVAFSVDATGKPNASGNKATLESATLAGARDVLNTVSDDGRFVMFSSASNNLALGVHNPRFTTGVYVRDMVARRTTLISTTATGNVPSAGLFVNYALATDAALAGKFPTYMDGTGAGDMQTRFRTEDLAPGPTSHVYQVAYPAVAQAASATNPAIFTVSGVGVNTRPVLEFRDPDAPITPSVRTSPGQLLPGFNGMWRTATGDINADGVVDYVYGAGLGGQDTVIVLDGRTNSVIWQVAGMFPRVQGATGANARPGVFVATADVNADGFADVIVGSDGPRQSRVVVYDGRRGRPMMAAPIVPFGAASRVAARVAGGDVDGDGYGDVVVGRGVGGRPLVRIYSGKLLQPNAQPPAALSSFAVAPVPGRPGSGSGVYVAAADMDRDGTAEVVVGFDKASRVSIYNGLTGGLVSTTTLGPAFAGGTRVAARAGQVMVASGAGTSPSIRLLAFASGTWTTKATLAGAQISGFSQGNKRGLFVG